MRTTATLAAAALLACSTAPSRSASPAVALDAAALAGRCERGFAADCRTLGRARLGGGELARDDRLAAALLTQACEMGDPGACSDLGVLFAIGRGVAQSDERATALARRACERGAAIACSNQGALLAEGAAPRAKERDEDAAAKVLRLFRAACDAGVSEGCANLGTALEVGRLAARDVRGAGAAFRRACDAGLALACHRLARLIAERPDVAPDLTATALGARACSASIAPACFAISERPPPDGARTPAARLVDEPGTFTLGIPGRGGFSAGELAVRAALHRRSPEEVRRPPAALQDAVPPVLRPRLALDLPPRPGDAADAPVDLLVALRRHQLGQCHEGSRQAPGVRAEAFASFFVDADGSAVEVRSATTPADPGLEACVREVVGQWEFPASPEGHSGPYLVREVFDAAPEGPAPVFAGPATLRPALRDPTCVERALRVPPEYRGSTGSVTVKLAVDEAGTPALVHALTFAPEALVSAVSDAIGRCAWTGGANDGRPASVWVTLTVKLDAR